ncbi:MAG: hypothetical protein IJ359_08435 [Erysipelotrichaceae bacterium]|nr:hypothetical protein [Erysipelotrichaceae bacterium]
MGSMYKSDKEIAEKAVQIVEEIKKDFHGIQVEKILDIAKILIKTL